MPPANMEKFYSELGIQSTYYVDIITKRIINLLNFELREITRFYTQVKAAVYEPTHESRRFDFSFPDGKGRQFILMTIVPLLIGLKIADISKYDNFVNGKDGKPLRELFDIEKEFSFLDTMLNRDESFEKEDGKTLVTRDDLIDKLYAAVFINEYTGREYCTNLGQYQFSKDSKTFAISASSMMSNFAVLS